MGNLAHENRHQLPQGAARRDCPGLVARPLRHNALGTPGDRTLDARGTSFVYSAIWARGYSSSVLAAYCPFGEALCSGREPVREVAQQQIL